MSKKKVLIGLTVALMATAAPAGEIKIHNWPYRFIPQEVVSIPVVMDIGYWLEILNQDAEIKLEQVSIHTYRGCVNLRVRANFNLTLSCSIVPTGAIGGQYSCSVQPADLNVPGGTTAVCAKLTEADLTGRPGGSRDVHVATVIIKVVPRT